MRNIMIATGIATILIVFGPSTVSADNVVMDRGSHSAVFIPGASAAAVTPVHRYWGVGPRWYGYYPYRSYYYPTPYPYAYSYAYPTYPNQYYTAYPYYYPYYGGGVYFSGPRRSFGVAF